MWCSLFFCMAYVLAIGELTRAVNQRGVFTCKILYFSDFFLILVLFFKKRDLRRDQTIIPKKKKNKFWTEIRLIYSKAPQ